jgi:hypothetical protein
VERATKGVKAGEGGSGTRRPTPAQTGPAISAEALHAAFDSLHQGFMLLDDE